MNEERDQEFVDDDAFRRHRAQNWWPQPPDGRTSDGALGHQPPSPPHWAPPTSGPAVPPAPPAPASRSAWRTIGIGALGLVAGFVIGLTIQDIIGVAFLAGGGSLMSPAGVLLGWLLPLSSVAGVVVATLIDRNVSLRGSRASEPRDARREQGGPLG